MNSQQLQDAMSYLPDDLLEEADRRRIASRPVIPFRRYLSIAACFVLLVSSGLILTRLIQPKGAAEMSVYTAAEAPAALAEAGPIHPGPVAEEVPADECAPMEEAPAADSAMGAPENRNTAAEPAAPPFLRLETPRKTGGTASYSSQPRITLVRSPEEFGDYIAHYDYQYHFKNTEATIAAYDSSWFEIHDLLLLAIHTVPTGSDCAITSFAEADGIWEIHVAHDAFAPQKPDTTDYHLLLTVAKGQIPDKNAVSLILDTQNQ